MARKPKQTPRPTLDTLMGVEPPHSLEAEMAVLGACLIDPKVIDTVNALLPQSDAFYSESHAAIWGAMLTTRGDLLALHERLRDTAQLEAVGGAEYLMRMAEETPGPQTVEFHARILSEKAKRRRLIAAAGGALHAAYNDGDKPADAILDGAVAAMLDAGRDSSAKDVRLSEAIDMVIADISAGKPQVWKTNLAPFDDMFGGVMQGAVTTIFGASNTGKTTLCMQLVLQLALSGVKVRVFSREQGPKRIAATIMQQLSPTPIPVHSMLNNGSMPDSQQWVSIQTTRKDAGLMDFAVVSDRLDAQQIYQRCMLYRRQGVKLVVIDYLQNLPPMPGVDRGVQQMEDACQCVQSIAVDLGIAVLAVSQITADASREASDERAPRCPQLSHCRGGNAIENISDMAFAVWRPHLNKRAEIGNEWDRDYAHAQRMETSVQCAKGKYMGRGGIKLRFNPAAMTFEEVGGQGSLI